MKSGMKIREIYFPDGKSRGTDDNSRLETLSEFHGEYDIDWVVVIDVDGKEIARHNTRYVESIVWLEQEEAV